MILIKVCELSTVNTRGTKYNYLVLHLYDRATECDIFSVYLDNVQICDIYVDDYDMSVSYMEDIIVEHLTDTTGKKIVNYLLTIIRYYD